MDGKWIVKPSGAAIYDGPASDIEKQFTESVEREMRVLEAMDSMTMSDEIHQLVDGVKNDSFMQSTYRADCEQLKKTHPTLEPFPEGMVRIMLDDENAHFYMIMNLFWFIAKYRPWKEDGTAACDIVKDLRTPADIEIHRMLSNPEMAKELLNFMDRFAKSVQDVGNAYMRTYMFYLVLCHLQKLEAAYRSDNTIMLKHTMEMTLYHLEPLGDVAIHLSEAIRKVYSK